MSCTLLLLAQNSTFVSAQTTDANDAKTLDRYLDQTNGMTADEAVRIALENNGELVALRIESEAAQSLIKQARLRPNPSLEASGSKQISGTDNSLMV